MTTSKTGGRGPWDPGFLDFRGEGIALAESEIGWDHIVEWVSSDDKGGGEDGKGVL
jgi:hypothetical protein